MNLVKKGGVQETWSAEDATTKAYGDVMFLCERVVGKWLNSELVILVQI
jgi:hypothetical protein